MHMCHHLSRLQGESRMLCLGVKQQAGSSSVVRNSKPSILQVMEVQFLNFWWPLHLDTSVGPLCQAHRVFCQLDEKAEEQLEYFWELQGWYQCDSSLQEPLSMGHKGADETHVPLEWGLEWMDPTVLHKFFQRTWLQVLDAKEVSPQELENDLRARGLQACHWNWGPLPL